MLGWYTNWIWNLRKKCKYIENICKILQMPSKVKKAPPRKLYYQHSDLFANWDMQDKRNWNRKQESMQ